MNTGLRRYGYTEREALFLQLAALLSGYFVRRQFNDFVERECGALAQNFMNRATRLGHLELVTALGNRSIAHVSGNSVYAALGDLTNRNRRAHRFDTIRRRLLMLDFAICHKENEWLLTESAKLGFFGSMGVPDADLPGARFPGRRNSFFVDKQPVSRCPGGALEMAFVDDGLRGFSKFEVFLKQHRTLLRKIRETTVVYVSPDPTRFGAAERLFRRTISGETATGGIDVGRLRSYFTARAQFDAKDYGSFNQARLDELRESRRVFSGEAFEALYLSWRAQGDGALGDVSPSQTFFRTFCLPHHYGWLSPIRTRERRGHNAPDSNASEKDSRGRNGQAR